MAIITISRGSYTRGMEIAEKTAKQLGYRCISREVLIKASEDFNIPEIDLIQAIEDAPSFLNRFTHGKEKYIAYIRAALLNHLKEDNIIYHGFVGHYFVRNLPHVLKVLIISGAEDRIKMIMDRENKSEEEAVHIMEKNDEQRKKWGLKLYGIDPCNPNLFDLVLNINSIKVKDAVGSICRIAKLKQFQAAPKTKKLLEDLAISAEVKTYLIGIKPNAEVRTENGFVTFCTESSPSQDSDLVNKMEEISKMIPGVKGIRIVTEKDRDRQPLSRHGTSLTRDKDKASVYITDLG